MENLSNAEKKALAEAASPAADQFHPSFRQEDQDMAEAMLKPVVIGPPAYASPDPATNAGKLVPIEDHPLAGMIDADFGKAYREEGVVSQPSPLAGTEDNPGGYMDSSAGMSAEELAEAKSLKAAEWKEMVESAEDAGELDDVVSKYQAAGASYATVDSAIEAKRAEFAG